MRVRLDWPGLEAALREQVVGFVREVCAEHPDDHLFSAAVFDLHTEAGGAIGWPLVGVLTEESLASFTVDALEADVMRWRPVNWPWWRDPTEAEEEWARRLEAAAVVDGGRDRAVVHDRFLEAVVAACHAARHELVREGVVGEDFVVVAMDDEEDLLPRTLTVAQMREHFPGLEEQRRELDRLAALPVAARVAGLVEMAETSTYGDRWKAIAVLRTIGPPVVPHVVEHLPRLREKWEWAKLLAEIGVADQPVIAALELVLADPQLAEPDRAWAAAALARLGRMDLVVARLAVLPEKVAVAGLTAPYTRYRDYGVHSALDYTPLADALTRHPNWQDTILRRFGPHDALCVLDADEVTTALDGLGSPHAAIRRHAVIVLHGAPMTAAQRDHYTTALTHLDSA